MFRHHANANAVAPAVITCHRRHLEARCRERGYTLEEVRPCIVSEDGDMVTVDELHAAYPRKRDGAGARLKRLLSRFGIRAQPGCKCNKRAAEMDARGPDWCEENLVAIVGWLREEHARQKVMLPFSSIAAEALVRYAIRRARRRDTKA
jgi:hypothetical protein